MEPLRQPELLNIHDTYADQFGLFVTPYGASLLFSVLTPESLDNTPGQPVKMLKVPRSFVRMSLQHAKVMTIIMERQLKKFEHDHGEIALPAKLKEAHNINPTDW